MLQLDDDSESQADEIQDEQEQDTTTSTGSANKLLSTLETATPSDNDNIGLRQQLSSVSH